MTSQQNKGPASAGPMFDRCKTWLNRADAVSKGLVVCAMAIMTLLVVTQVVFRYAFASAIDWSDEVARLAPLLRNSADNQQLSGSILNCRWVDVGTPERLAQLNLLVEENK